MKAIFKKKRMEKENIRANSHFMNIVNIIRSRMTTELPISEVGTFSLAWSAALSPLSLCSLSFSSPLLSVTLEK